MVTLTASTIAAAPSRSPSTWGRAPSQDQPAVLRLPLRSAHPSGARLLLANDLWRVLRAPQLNVTEGKASDVVLALSAGVHGSVATTRRRWRRRCTRVVAHDHRLGGTRRRSRERADADGVINRGLGNEASSLRRARSRGTSSRVAKTPSRSSSVSRTLSAASTRARPSPSGRPTSSVARRRTTG